MYSVETVTSHSTVHHCLCVCVYPHSPYGWCNIPNFRGHEVTGLLFNFEGFNKDHCLFSWTAVPQKMPN